MTSSFVFSRLCAFLVYSAFECTSLLFSILPTHLFMDLSTAGRQHVFVSLNISLIKRFISTPPASNSQPVGSHTHSRRLCQAVKARCLSFCCGRIWPFPFDFTISLKNISFLKSASSSPFVPFLLATDQLDICWAYPVTTKFKEHVLPTFKREMHEWCSANCMLV